MKLKLIAVDLELTRLQKVGILAGLAACFSAVAAVASAAPKIFSANETLTATDLNASFSDLDQRTMAIEATLSPTGSLQTTNLTVSGDVSVGGLTDMGLHASKQCTFAAPPGLGFTDCTCGLNEVAVGGGGFCSDGVDGALVESQNSNLVSSGTLGKTWRVTCLDLTSHARYAANGAFAVCARLKSN